MLRFHSNALLIAIVLIGGNPVIGTEPVVERSQLPMVGFTQFRTNLPGGRHANVTTMRARVVKADGSQNRPIADSLVTREHSWTQFAGWSPDGTRAVIGCGWESPGNARWEEEHRTFRFNEDGWLYDVHLVNVADGRAENVTAVERVSHYNSGLFFWPDNPDQLGFTALINGISHPFRMNLDGTNKVDLTEGTDGFTYGFEASPDGSRIAYHKDYQVYLADADGSHATHIETGHPFNFVPMWSPDGEHVLFVSGEHYDCHPHVVGRDGSHLRKLADRNGYRGVVEFLDVEDFHGGSSDVPVWSIDGRLVFFTRRVGTSIELAQVDLDGTVTQLTRSPEGAHTYHPTPSPDGRAIIFGSNRTRTRQLYVLDLRSGEERALTDVPADHGAMWPHWQRFAE
ncbi:MAG: PD40 domain-containing protein [Planctomycetaceae bacterium]|nr:PD40 domain-containing protein [Planctomycetaceae bacterium]